MMRKFLIPLAAAASAFAMTAPASAQAYGNLGPWTAPVYNYQPYNYGYGFNGYRFVREMSSRVQRIRGDIGNMEARRILSPREARSLDREARAIERQIYKAPRNGIRPGEARGIENRIRRLEYRVAREARDWNGRPGRWGGYDRHDRH
jgi:hypothetical protein